MHALIEGPRSFIALRFLLGAGEAGFFPGIIFYLTCWFPPRDRARIVLDDHFGLRAWQWMFILEALPTVLLGFACLKWRPDRPETASWLTQAERTRLPTQTRDEQNRLVSPRGCRSGRC